MKRAILLFAIFATECYGCSPKNSVYTFKCGANQFCFQDDNWGHCKFCPSNGPDGCYGLDSTYWSISHCISHCPDVSTSEYIEQMNRYLSFCRLLLPLLFQQVFQK